MKDDIFIMRFLVAEKNTGVGVIETDTEHFAATPVINLMARKSAL